MADTIHKKKKNWPHFDKIHLGSSAYAEGYDRIFGSKNEEEDDGTRKRRTLQKTRVKSKEKGRKKSKGSRSVDRSKKVRREEND